MTIAKVTKTISAENTFSDEIAIRGGSKFTVLIFGTWDATVSLMKKYTGDDTWYVRKTYTANTHSILEEPEDGVLYKIGVATGDFTSGDVEVRISQ